MKRKTIEASLAPDKHVEGVKVHDASTELVLQSGSFGSSAVGPSIALEKCKFYHVVVFSCTHMTAAVQQPVDLITTA